MKAKPLILGLIGGAVGWLLIGCAALAARQQMATSAPAADPQLVAGAIATAIKSEIAATGIQYQSTLGVGATILLAMAFGVRPYLKHRRRMAEMRKGS